MLYYSYKGVANIMNKIFSNFLNANLSGKNKKYNNIMLLADERHFLGHLLQKIPYDNELQRLLHE